MHIQCRTARRSLELSSRIGQATYESAKADRLPIVSLLLTEVDYRRPTARPLPSFIGHEARMWAEKLEASSLEIVIRGRIKNNLSHEVLLTCSDHENSGRTTWSPHRNQSVFLLGNAEVELGRAILSPGNEAEFTWIDRRPKSEWTDICKLHRSNRRNDPDLRIPWPTHYVFLREFWHSRSLRWARRSAVKRSGFSIVCESRVAQRVATVWHAEVVKTPVESGGRDEEERIVFDDWIGKVRGPIDDSTVFYRVAFDSSLAQVNTPRIIHVAGRH